VTGGERDERQRADRGDRTEQVDRRAAGRDGLDQSEQRYSQPDHGEQERREQC
jgi:hypothetical protein